MLKSIVASAAPRLPAANRLAPAVALALALLAGFPAYSQTTTAEKFAEAQRNLDVEDIPTAMRLFRELAAEGHTKAQIRLAWILEGVGDLDEAFRWYQAAAAGGDPEGMLRLAEMYVKGEAVALDVAKAAELVTGSAQQGYAPAMKTLAEAHENGSLGFARDDETALEWYRRGLEADEPWAADRLARAYRNGQLGLSVDAARAEELASRARTALPVTQ